MTIEEMQKLKAAVESEIERMLNAFHQTTGLSVDSVEFGTLTASDATGKPVAVTYCNTRMEVRL